MKEMTTSHSTEQMDETVEVSPSSPHISSFPISPHMLTLQFCVLVVEQGITFLENLASLDSPSSSLTTVELFDRKSQILPNSVIGRHLRYAD